MNAHQKHLRTASAKIIKILNSFRELDKHTEMGLGEAMVLLAIYEGEKDVYGGISAVDICNQRGWYHPTTMSRYVRSLARVDRQGRPGLNLVIQEEHPTSGRAKILKLSPAGHNFVSRLADIVNGPVTP